MLPAAPTSASPRQQALIVAYFSILFAGANLQGLLALPLSFYFKNQLHLDAQRLSLFGLITGIPLYFSVFFGLLRDTWRPRRMGDRAYLLLGGVGLSATYLVLTLLPMTWLPLMVGGIATALFALFVSAALNSLTILVGQQRLMTGRLSALSNFWGSACSIVVNLVGGALADNWPLRSVFYLMAAIAASLVLQALWHSRDIFAPEAPALPRERLRLDLRPLFRHRAALLAALIWMLWNFAPGAATATMFYLQNTIKMTDIQYGWYNAVFSAAFVPFFVVYSLLCRRFSLRSLLFWGTLIAIPQFVPLLFVRTPTSAFGCAALMGAMGGIAASAYYDLLIRACPKGLEGTLMMVAATGFAIVSRFGDLLGSWIFDRWQFLPCVVLITLVYASILIVLAFLPRTITEDREEQSQHRIEEYAHG